MTYDGDLADLVVLYGGEEGLELKTREDDDTVAAVRACVCDYYQRIDMAERQEAQRRLRIYTQFFA